MLFERKNKNGSILGITDNYIKIEAKYNKKLENKIINYKLENITSKQIFA